MIDPATTDMFQEAAEAPDCVARQARECEPQISAIGDALRRLSPPFIATIARGSSDHAATYGKYLIETASGSVVTSYAPSVSSVYDAHSTMAGGACIAISQSGRSPDLVSSLETAKRGGAATIALVNDTSSPLAHHADHVASLCAYPEKAVAATKSYLASLAMLARITASWQQDAVLQDAIDRLPDDMRAAWKCDWSAVDDAVADAGNLFVIARGIGLGVAQEAALKFKETCRIHAEAYSAAEVLHGPAAIVRPGFPVIAFAQNDASRESVLSTCGRLAAMGARVFIAGGDAAGCTALPHVAADARLQPVLIAQSFYRLVNRIAVARGENPDAPPHLMKVTETT